MDGGNRADSGRLNSGDSEGGMRACTYPECPRPYAQGGYCAMHLSRLRRTGELGPLGTLANPDNLPFRELIFSQAKIQPNGCVQWTGYVHERTGYGIAPKYKGEQLAHRVFYMWQTGQSIPQGMQIDHLCRNRLCANVAHMEVVSPQVNTLRSTAVTALNASKTHCVRGHELSGDNLKPTPWRERGHRVCMQCIRVRKKEKRHGASV